MADRLHADDVLNFSYMRDIAKYIEHPRSCTPQLRLRMAVAFRYLSELESSALQRANAALCPVRGNPAGKRPLLSGVRCACLAAFADAHDGYAIGGAFTGER